MKANAFLTSLFVSDDGRSTAVLVDFDDFTKAGGPPKLAPTLEAIVGPEREPGLEILPAGAPTIMHWLMIYTRRVALLFVLALAMIGYLHYRAFRTLQGMIIPLVTAIMGVLWALGLMGLIGAPMDPWNIMTPILLLAIGAGHSVQILKRYYEEYARARSTRPDVPAWSTTASPSSRRRSRSASSCWRRGRSRRSASRRWRRSGCRRSRTSACARRSASSRR